MKKVLLLAFVAVMSVSTSFAQDKAKPALNQVLNAYYELKNALADDKADLAVDKAKKLSVQIEAVSIKDIPTTQQKLWLTKSSLIKVKAKTLAATKNLEAQRKIFEGVANPMVDLVKGLAFNNATAYVQYCPHAKKSWLNDVEAVQNPYYGSMMYACGSVKETLDKK